MSNETTTAISLLDRLSAGEITSESIVRDLLERSDRARRLNAFVHLDPATVLAQARSVDEKRKAGEMVGRLAGVPVAIKDVLCVEGEPTTCGSRMLRNFRPPYDATVIAKLRAAGAILFGKTNMDEFAMGSSTENSAYGPTLNPWDPARVPGGSSGGSASAVAAGLAPLALGTDTGGSIRQPAAFCGVVGLKPTYGRVSRYGLIAFASSLDQVGPFARDVADAALLLSVISGPDPHDSTSVDQPIPDYVSNLNTPPDSLRVGFAREFFTAGLDPEIATAVQDAIRVYEKAGATIKEISLPHSNYGIPAYYIVAPAECSSNLARYDGTIYGHRAGDYAAKYPNEEGLPPLVRMMMASRAEGFGPEVKRRIMLTLGTFAAIGYSCRPVLQQGSQGPAQDPRRLRCGLPRGRRNLRSNLAYARVCNWRAHGRPTGYVSVGHLHDHGQPGRHPGHQRCPASFYQEPACRSACWLLAAPFAEDTLLHSAQIFRRAATDLRPKRPGLPYNAGRIEVSEPQGTGVRTTRRRDGPSRGRQGSIRGRSLCFGDCHGDLFA